MYRPVDIVIPPGAICSALPPQGVVFAYGESTNALLLAMLQAMADAVGEDAVAGDMGSPNLHTARGVNADGTPWIAVGVAGGEAGPWGATSAGDADSYSKFYQANSIDTAVEVSEADSPVVVLRREYVADSGGAGYNRGGAAVLKDSTFLAPAAHNLIVLRFKEPTGKGVRGGGDGATGGVWLWHAPPGERVARPGTGAESYRSAIRVAGRLDTTTGLPGRTAEYSLVRPRSRMGDGTRCGLALHDQWRRRLGRRPCARAGARAARRARRLRDDRGRPVAVRRRGGRRSACRIRRGCASTNRLRRPCAALQARSGPESVGLREIGDHPSG